MPRERSIKQLLGETIIFISMFALAGHLSVNFWEKYVIQNELSLMKSSLHSMKKTINNIGNAYDNLQKELKGLKQITKNKPQTKEPVYPNKNAYTVTQKTRKDVQVHAVATSNNKSCLTYNNEKIHSDKRSDATTITRYPVKSTKVGSDIESLAETGNCRYVICDNKLRKCYKECDECQPTGNHWKF